MDGGGGADRRSPLAARRSQPRSVFIVNATVAALSLLMCASGIYHAETDERAAGDEERGVTGGVVFGARSLARFSRDGGRPRLVVDGYLRSLGVSVPCLVCAVLRSIAIDRPGVRSLAVGTA